MEDVKYSNQKNAKRLLTIAQQVYNNIPCPHLVPDGIKFVASLTGFAETMWKNVDHILFIDVGTLMGWSSAMAYHSLRDVNSQVYNDSKSFDVITVDNLQGDPALAAHGNIWDMPEYTFLNRPLTDQERDSWITQVQTNLVEANAENVGMYLGLSVFDNEFIEAVKMRMLAQPGCGVILFIDGDHGPGFCTKVMTTMLPIIGRKNVVILCDDINFKTTSDDLTEMGIYLRRESIPAQSFVVTSEPRYGGFVLDMGLDQDEQNPKESTG